jgi:hypothetical protein
MITMSKLGASGMRERIPVFTETVSCWSAVTLTA